MKQIQTLDGRKRSGPLRTAHILIKKKKKTKTRESKNNVLAPCQIGLTLGVRGLHIKLTVSIETGSCYRNRTTK